MAAYTPVIRLPSSKRKPNGENSPITQQQQGAFEPKDCLVSDTLFLSTLPKNVRETDIRTLLQHCMPIEIIIDLEKDIGQLRFSQPKYADRAYSLYNGFTFTNNTRLQLQMYQDSKLDPEAYAVLLEINNLPDYYDDNKLYDLFRPFGPLNLCKCVMKDGTFRGTAFVQFFNTFSSQESERQLNGRSLDGYKLSVVPFMPSKSYASSTAVKEETTEDTANTNNTVDIMNLYIKNLEPHITNQDLTQIFGKFGRIISARVMTNPQTGQSKGYGFVSFGNSEEAALALQEMNGQMLGNRPLTVAYHEPRKGSVSSGGARGAGGNQQQQQQQQDYSQQQSYYNSNNNSNAYNQNNNHNSYNQQQQRSNYIPNNTPTPTTQIKGLGIENVDELGINLKDLSIGQVKQVSPLVITPPPTINLPSRKLSTSNYTPPQQQQLNTPSPSTTTGGSRSLASLASGLSIQQAPPSTQPLVSLGYNGRPTLRRRGSLESVMTESSANIQRTKLEQAVRNCGDYGKVTNDIVDMLLTLKRKERSLCLFNPDFLKEKVDLALEALATCNEDTDSEDDDEEDDMDGLDMEYTMRKINLPASVTTFKKSPSLPQPQNAPYYNPAQQLRPSPIIPLTSSPPLIQRRESKAIPIIAPPPPPTAPSTTSGSSATATASLTKENLAQKESADKDVETLLFSFQGKPIHEKKQLLGDKLFPLVKSTGTRQAPKVTIYLLDTVDLHELAKIMYDTPLLKQRVDEAFQALQSQQS